MRTVNVVYRDPSESVHLPVTPVWTLGQAAAMLNIPPRALSRHLQRHPELAEPRYGRGPSRRWERLLTSDKIVAIQRSRFRSVFPPAAAKRRATSTSPVQEGTRDVDC